jgi:hypothetical protein
VERSPEVNVQDNLQILGGKLRERLVPQDSGVVDEDV